MPPKRKSDAIELMDPAAIPAAGSSKKARTSEAGEASAFASSSKIPATDLKTPKSWQDIVLEGEDDDEGVPLYDDCNDIRRKIRNLLKEPGFKITYWLKDIGNINNNSYQRFMKETGPTSGASNGTYVAAYKYFEKRRILEGKKKTPKRIRNEEENGGGLSLRDRRHVWVFTGR